MGLVDEQGKITYQGGPGPRGFLPDELETAIRKQLKLPAAKPSERQPRRPRREREGDTSQQPGGA